MANEELRAGFPPELVEFLEDRDDEVARLWDRAAVLPAVETPEVLVELAQRLVGLFEVHAGVGDVDVLAGSVGRALGRVLAREVTEPFRAAPGLGHVVPVPPEVPKEVMRAYSEFLDRCAGRDWTVPAQRAELARTWELKKRKVEQFGFELDLTPEQWADL